MSKEDKHAHDKFRKDALKAIKEGRLEKAKHFYEAAIGNCAYISTMLELADLYLKMGMHQKEAKDLATRVLLVPDVKASQQKHATKILHQLLPPPSASPPASGPMVFGAAAAAAAAAASASTLQLRNARVRHTQQQNNGSTSEIAPRHFDLPSARRVKKLVLAAICVCCPF